MADAVRPTDIDHRFARVQAVLAQMPNAEHRKQALFRDMRRQERGLIEALVRAAQAGDAEGFENTLVAINEEDSQVWRASMRAIARVSCPEEFRRAFLDIYLRRGDQIRAGVLGVQIRGGVLGDQIRGGVRGDLILINALRSLLPRYTGEDMTLYRGETALNRKNRTYGHAWTSSREVALSYALGNRRETEGGSVLLQASAPKEAIISAPGLMDDGYKEEEEEYVVDRRGLTDIRVIERFSQVES